MIPRCSDRPRVFGVDYQFLSCGDVFTRGLAHAAAGLVPSPVATTAMQVASRVVFLLVPVA